MAGICLPTRHRLQEQLVVWIVGQLLVPSRLLLALSRNETPITLVTSRLAYLFRKQNSKSSLLRGNSL